MQTYLLDSGARHTALLLSHLCKVADLLLLATGSASLQVWAGLVSSAWQANTENILIKKVHKQASKKISNEIKWM